MGADLSVKQKLGVFVSDHRKVSELAGGGVVQVSKVGAHKERLRERGKIEGGERVASTPKSH